MTSTCNHASVTRASPSRATTIVTTNQYGAGERVRLEGDGTDGVIAHVSVGDAHVRVR